MSVDAVSWAYKQKIKSSVKFVLVTLCDFANDDGKLWPSVATICERTCQDRKTVMNAIDELENLGCLIDTGERKGGTGQVKVYRINQIDLTENSTKNGTVKMPNSTKTGTVKECQKRDTLNTERVPNFPLKSTKFPTKEYQISHERVPNLVHGTINEPYIELLKEPSNTRTRVREKPPKSELFFLPDWIPKDAWFGYEEMRKAKKKPMTPRARELIIKKLDDFRRKGFDIKSILNTSIINNWTDVYAPKPKPPPNHQKLTAYEQTMQAAEEAKKLIFGEKTA